MKNNNKHQMQIKNQNVTCMVNKEGRSPDLNTKTDEADSGTGKQNFIRLDWSSLYSINKGITGELLLSDHL